MINPLERLRIRFPYVWRLRPHTVIPLALLLAGGLPLLFDTSQFQWDFSKLWGVEYMLEGLGLGKRMLQLLVIFALLPWARQLIAFPLRDAGWRRILLTLLFYWAVIACAFLGPELAIDSGPRVMYGKTLNVPAVDTPWIHRYFGICLLAAVGLLSITEWIGRGSFRPGLLADRLRNRLPRMVWGVLAARMARSTPVVWSLGLPRIFSDTFILLCTILGITILILVSVAMPLTASDYGGYFVGILWLYLIPLVGLFVFREPIEHTQFPSFRKNWLYTMLAATHFSLLYGVGIFGILLVHEIWSHLHGSSNFPDLQIIRIVVDIELIAPTIFMLAVSSWIATTVRIAYLSGGFRMMASTFMTSVTTAVVSVFLISELDLSPEFVFWWGMGGLVAVLCCYLVLRVSNPAAHGALLGVLLVSSPFYGLYLSGSYMFEIEAVLGSWYENLDRGQQGLILILIWTGLAYPVILPAWSLGLKLTTRAIATPR